MHMYLYQYLNSAYAKGDILCKFVITFREKNHRISLVTKCFAPVIKQHRIMLLFLYTNVQFNDICLTHRLTRRKRYFM